MNEHEADRIKIGLTWPTPVPYSSIRVEIAHSFYPGEKREESADWLIDKLLALIEREEQRVLLRLAPEKAARATESVTGHAAPDRKRE